MELIQALFHRWGLTTYQVHVIYDPFAYIFIIILTLSMYIFSS